MTQTSVLYARLSVTTEVSVSIARQIESGRRYSRSAGWSLPLGHLGAVAAK